MIFKEISEINSIYLLVATVLIIVLVLLGSYILIEQETMIELSDVRTELKIECMF